MLGLLNRRTAPKQRYTRDLYGTGGIGAPPSRPVTVDLERRTALFCAATSTVVQRYGKRPDGTVGAWGERLDLAGADLRRLRGASVVLDHDARAQNVIGVIESYEIRGDQLFVTARIGRGPRADAYLQDISDGILRQVSIGYQVEEWERGEGNLWTARIWIPLEVSLVAIAADPNATVRSSVDNSEETAMFGRNSASSAQGAPSNRGDDNELVLDRGTVVVSASRAAEISTALNSRGFGPYVGDFLPRAAELPASFEADLDELADIGRRLGREHGAVGMRAYVRSLNRLEACRAAINSHAAAAEQNQVSTNHIDIVPGTSRRQDSDQARTAIHAGAVRIYPGLANVSAEAREMARQHTVMELARIFENRGGARAAGAGLPGFPGDLYGRGSSTGGYHTSSDFTSYLSPVMGTILADPNVIPPSPLQVIAQQRTTADFHPVAVTRLDFATDLLAVQEHGEIRRGSLTDSAEAVTVQTFARIFGITRQALVNDQFGRLRDTVAMFSNAVQARTDSVLHAPLLANSRAGQTMSDGKPFFHADHGNRAVSGSALDVAGLSAARLAMRKQKTVTNEPMFLTPRYLLVGPELETQAEQLLTAINAAAPGDVNPFPGKLTLVVSPRITDRSWYVFADPAQHAAIVMLTLDGSRPFSGPGVQLDQRRAFDLDGWEFRAILDVGAGALLPAAAYYNPGL